MKSTKLKKSLFSLLLVVMALAVTMVGFAPATAAGRSTDPDKKTVEALADYYAAQRFTSTFVDAAVLKAQLAKGEKPFLIDLRDPTTYSAGHIAYAKNIPMADLVDKLDKLPKDRTQPIVVYCYGGHYGAMAALTLNLLGYTNVKSVLGGYGGWTAVQ